MLEIGSGTGQHGAYISQHYPSILWQCSDCEENINGIQAWVDDSTNDNFLSPLTLDINHAQWSQPKIHYVYSANTAHIMSWPEVIRLFEFIPHCLQQDGYFFLYGPFNYKGQFTSPSNQQFNEWLKSQAPHRAIRDFESINTLALEQNLTLVNDHAMPANNRLLAWQLR